MRWAFCVEQRHHKNAVVCQIIVATVLTSIVRREAQEEKGVAKALKQKEGVETQKERPQKCQEPQGWDLTIRDGTMLQTQQMMPI